MEQLNKIEIRGVVGFSRLSKFNDRRVLNFSVVTDYVYKGSSGEPVIETTWHYVNAWEGKYMPDLSTITKGTKVYVCGRLRSQKYADSQGIERSSYEVIASQLSVLQDQSQMQCESSR